MNETLKRSLSGAIYVFIMWFGTTYSDTSFHCLFIIILIIAIYEMWNLRKGYKSLLPYLYIIIPLILIHQIGNRDRILYILILTWIFDTFAYLFGKRFGNNKIMRSISPKKSWEGFAGGSICSIISSFIILNGRDLFREVLGIEIHEDEVLSLYVITFILPFTSTLGDFIESYYKRKANVKDSGKFIPGHGGMLDRIDSLLITIPVLYIINYLTNNTL